MASGGQKTGLAIIGTGQFLIHLGEFAGTLGDHVLQIFVDLAKRLFVTLALGNVHVGTDKTATDHGRAAHFHNDTVGQLPFELVGVTFAQQLHPLAHIFFQVLPLVVATLRVITVHILNGAPQPDQSIRIIKQLHVGLVPGHHLHLPVHHADTLADGFDGGAQQLVIELNELGSLIHHPHHIVMATVLLAQQGAHHDPCGGGAHGARQQPLHVAHQMQGRRQFQLFGHIAAAHVIEEQRLGPRMPQPSFAHFQQFRSGNGRMADAFTPPVHGHIHKPGRLGLIKGIVGSTTGEINERGQVHRQGPEHSMGERLQPLNAEHGMGPQQPQPQQPPLIERLHPLHRQNHRHQQAVEPQQKPDTQPGKGPLLVPGAPVQGPHQRRRKLRHGGKGQQANTGQAIEPVNQGMKGKGQAQQDQNTGPTQKPQLTAQPGQLVPLMKPGLQPQRQQHFIGQHDGQRHRGHDHHTGCRRDTANKRHHQHGRIILGHGQRQHVGVGLTYQVRLGDDAGHHDGQYKDGKHQQIQRKEPARGT